MRAGKSSPSWLARTLRESTLQGEHMSTNRRGFLKTLLGALIAAPALVVAPKLLEGQNEESVRIENLSPMTDEIIDQMEEEILQKKVLKAQILRELEEAQEREELKEKIVELRQRIEQQIEENVYLKMREQSTPVQTPDQQQPYPNGHRVNGCPADATTRFTYYWDTIVKGW